MPNTKLLDADRVSFIPCVIMRTHIQIIEDAKGPTALARAIGVDPNTAKAWGRNKSIPGAHWVSVAAAGIATLEELALAAAVRREAAA